MRFYQLKQIIRISILLAIVIAGVVNAATSTEGVKFAIEPKFIAAEDFADGLAKVGFGTSTNSGYAGNVNIESYGYIDRTGKLIIPDAKFAIAGNFSQGLAVVGIDTNRDPNLVVSHWSCPLDNSHRTDADCRYGYIDKTGKTVIAPQFTSAGRFSEGLAPVTTTDRQGYIDKTGKMVLELKYSRVGEFSEGMASVGIETNTSGSRQTKYGYINRTGKLVIPLKFFEARKFSQGLAVAVARSANLKNPQVTRGYINKQGKFIIQKPELDVNDYGDFHEGMAVIKLGGNACYARDYYCNYAYLNRQGKIAISQSFIAIKNFDRGLAPVATGGGGGDAGGSYTIANWGFINKQGKFVNVLGAGFTKDFRFEDAGSFSEGLAKVKVNGKYGYISQP